MTYFLTPKKNIFPVSIILNTPRAWSVMRDRQKSTTVDHWWWFFLYSSHGVWWLQSMSKFKDVKASSNLIGQLNNEVFIFERKFKKENLAWNHKHSAKTCFTSIRHDFDHSNKFFDKNQSLWPKRNIGLDSSHSKNTSHG